MEILSYEEYENLRKILKKALRVGKSEEPIDLVTTAGLFRTLCRIFRDFDNPYAEEDGAWGIIERALDSER